MVAQLILGSPGNAEEEVMPRSNPRSLSETDRHIGALRDFLGSLRGGLDALEPVLTERSLEDPNTDIDAAMDHRVTREASPLLLRQAQRQLLLYWLASQRSRTHASFVGS
jgi:hypothetical protein